MTNLIDAVIYGAFFFILWLWCSLTEYLVGENFGVIMAILMIGTLIAYLIMSKGKEHEGGRR